MSDERHPADPPRLARQGGETAELLRSAEPEFRERLDESEAFRRIERARRLRTTVSWALSGVAAAAVIALLAQGAGTFRASPAEITVTAETLRPEAPAPPKTAPPEKEQPAARVVEAPPPKALPMPVAAEHLDEAGCRKLAQQGDGERAVECYQALARGTGLGAEHASYQAARVSVESLGDARRALRALDEHAARFPGGTFRGEVRWLRIQSLERAGRLEEALSESEALLAAPEGRSLSSELHWLRARIYDDARRDCQSAVSELVALVGETGARGDDAEMRRAACLERLGRASEARAAYEQYLKREAPRRVDEARAKVEALRP